MAGVRGVARVRSVARMRPVRGKLDGCHSVLEHNICTRQILTRAGDYCRGCGVERDDGCVSTRRSEDTANCCRKRFQKALLHSLPLADLNFD